MKKLLFLLLISFGILISCNKDKSEENIQNTKENYTKLNKKVIDVTKSQNINKITANTIIFENISSQLSNKKVGDIIFSGKRDNYEKGFARKIKSIEKQNGKIIFHTEQAGIKEVFDEIHINSPIKIDYAKKPIVPNNIVEGQKKNVQTRILFLKK